MTTNTNLDDLVTQVSQLTDATTDLLNATNVSKQTLDTAVTDAEASANKAESASRDVEASVRIAQTAAEEAKEAEDNAVAVVYEGEASLEPGPGKLAIADSDGKFVSGWLRQTGVPTPDFHAPLTNNLQLAQGHGNAVKLDISPDQNGSVMVDLPIFQVSYSRSSKKTYIDKSGKLVELEINEPAITKDGYWHENSATNLITNSNGIGWGTFNLSTITTESRGGVMGTDCARGYFPPQPSNCWFRTNNASISGYGTASGYVKYVSGTPIIRLNIYNGLRDESVTFNMETMEFSSPSDNIYKYSAKPYLNDWIYLTVTVRNFDGGTNHNFSIRNHVSNEGTLLFDAWQLEAKSIASSYIPTTGEATTRSADSMSFSCLYNLPEKTASFTIALTFDVYDTGNLITRMISNSGSSISYLSISTSGSLSFGYFGGVSTSVSGYPLKGTVVGIYDAEAKSRWVYRVGADSASKIVDSPNFDTSISGSYSVGPYPWSGDKGTQGFFKDIRVWHHVLTPEQINNL